MFGAPPSAAPPAAALLQELPDLIIVHKRRDANDKAAPGGPFLGRTFDGEPQTSPRSSREDPVARGVLSRLNAPFRSAYARRTRKNIARLSPKMAYKAPAPSHTHPGDEIVNPVTPS